MFKLGGQADQGTGIMSTVEPKQTMRQNPYKGYAIGGRIGYAEAGPVKFQDSPFFQPGMSVMESREAYNQYIADRNKKLFEKDPGFQKYMESVSTPRPLSDREGILKILRDQGEFADVRGRPTFKMEEEAIKKFKEQDVEKTSKSFEEQAATEERAALGRTQISLPSKLSPGMKDNKYDDTNRSKPFNLLNEVKRESAELKELLKDENYSKGELALLLSAALGKPGTISEKIQEATKLALPMARARKEEDKAVTIAAYKLAKEKEQQQIRAGALPEGLKILKAQAEKQAAVTGRDAEEVYSELLRQNIKLDPITAESVQTLSSTPVYGEITKLVDSIKDVKRRREDAIAAKKDTKAIDRELLELNSRLDTFKGTKGFDIIYGDIVSGLKSGGRVRKAIGGDVEEVEDNKLIASNVSFGENKTQDATVVEKPVEKLSYPQLRDRLPKEITDDVVMLLSNSEEALQDFAYIRTQDDVSKFNVKYGVNLVVPPTAG